MGADIKQKIEKYTNCFSFWAAQVYRFYVRSLIRWIIAWPQPKHLKSGCTVIIGMCSRLPDILPANLECLRLAKWTDLNEVIVAVDCRKDRFPEDVAVKICERFRDLNVRFVFYSRLQSVVAEWLKQPYVYCWLSWCLAIKEVKTDSFYIHDYDALLLGNVLEGRYAEFKKHKRYMQGVQWYIANGIYPSDGFVSTFEAFVNTQWLRKLQPIEMFNAIGRLEGRRVDYDILLDIQRNYSTLSQRGVIEMKDDELVHPTQMIHQYTVYRKFPGKPWNCAALVMIPLFYYLSGRKEIFETAIKQIEQRNGKVIVLLNDGCVMNFEKLKLSHLNRMFLLMIQTFICLKIAPFADFLRYTEALYSLINQPEGERWQMPMSDRQRQWVNDLRDIKR